MNTEQLIRSARDGIAGKHPEHGWRIEDGTERAIAYALLALVAEQQITNSQLASLDITLGRIAKALERAPQSASDPAPKRRLRFAVRRKSSPGISTH